MNRRREREISLATSDLGSEGVNAAFPRWIQIHGRRRSHSPVEKEVSFSSAVLKKEFVNIRSEETEIDGSLSESSDTDSSDIRREENEKQINKLRCKRISSYRRQLLSLINSISSNTSRKSYFKNLSRILSNYRSPVKKRSPVTLESISFQLLNRTRKPHHKPNNKRFYHIYKENLKRLISKSMPKHFTMTLNSDATPRQYQCTLEPLRDTLSSSGAGRSKSRRRDRPNSRGTRQSSTKNQSRRSETRSRSPSPENGGVRKRILIKRCEENAVGDRESLTTRRRRKSRNGSISLSRRPSLTSRRSTDSTRDQCEQSPPRSPQSPMEEERYFRDEKRVCEVCDGEISTTKPRMIKEKRRVKKTKIKSVSSTQSINGKQNDSDNAEKNSDSCPTIKPNRMKKKMKIKIPDCSLSMILQELVKNSRIRKESQLFEAKEIKEDNTNMFPQPRRTIINTLAKKRYGREMKIVDLIAAFADTHNRRRSTENMFGISEERPFDGSEHFGDSKRKGKDDSSPSETESTESTRQKKFRIKNPSESSVAPKTKIRKRRSPNKEAQISLFPPSYKKKDAVNSIVESAAEDLNRSDSGKDSASSTNLKYDKAKTENSQKRVVRRSSATNVAREKLVRSIRENGAPRKHSKPQNAASKKESGDSVGRRSRLSSRQSKEEGEAVKQVVASSRRGRRREPTGEETRPKTESVKRPKSQGNKQEKSLMPMPRIPRRRPPKGYLTFEQVVGTNSPQPAEQLSWEALVNARDENGVSPVGLLRLKRRRRRRRLLTPHNSSLKTFPCVDLTQRKRSAAMADSLETAARRLVVRQRLGIEKSVVRETSPPSRRKKRWDLVIPAYYYDHEYYLMAEQDSQEKLGKRSEDEIPPLKRRRLS